MNIRQRGHECFYTLSKPAHINWASSTAADYHNRFLRSSDGWADLECRHRKLFKELSVFLYLRLLFVCLSRGRFDSFIPAVWWTVSFERSSQLHLPSQRTAGVKTREAAEGPHWKDVSVGGVADSAALVEHTSDILLGREKNHILKLTFGKWSLL